MYSHADYTPLDEHTGSYGRRVPALQNRCPSPSPWSNTREVFAIPPQPVEEKTNTVSLIIKTSMTLSNLRSPGSIYVGHNNLTIHHG